MSKKGLVDKFERIFMELHLDMYQTLAIAVLVLLLGRFLKKKI